jgi:hypothetical protein
MSETRRRESGVTEVGVRDGRPRPIRIVKGIAGPALRLGGYNGVSVGVHSLNTNQGRLLAEKDGENSVVRWNGKSVARVERDLSRFLEAQPNGRRKTE